MTYDDLLALARRCEGRTLVTVRGKRFRIGIYRDCAFFTPESSGYLQSDGRAAAERFVARSNDIGSLRPGDYSRVTRNAWYYVALLRTDSSCDTGRLGRTRSSARSGPLHAHVVDAAFEEAVAATVGRLGCAIALSTSRAIEGYERVSRASSSSLVTVFQLRLVTATPSRLSVSIPASLEAWSPNLNQT